MGDEEMSERMGHMLPSGPTLPGTRARGIARGLPQVAERVGVGGEELCFGI
jgi:hypothetical protein